MADGARGRQRRAEQIALGVVAAFSAKKAQLTAGLDPLRDHPPAEVVGQPDDPADETIVHGIAADVIDQCSTTSPALSNSACSDHSSHLTEPSGSLEPIS